MRKYSGWSHQGLRAQVALVGSLRVSPDRTGVENMESTGEAAPASEGSLEMGREPKRVPNARHDPTCVGPGAAVRCLHI